MSISRADNHSSRRQFLHAASAAATMSAFMTSPLHAIAQQSGAVAAQHEELGMEPNPTPDAALKFLPDGSVKPFAGNTVICHLPQQCRFRDGTVALHDALLRSSFAHKLGILPTESYHMTIYAGANDQARAHSSWPGGVPLDASIEQCDSIMKERMEKVLLEGPFPLRVRINVDATMRYGRASTLRMEGADASSEQVLRKIRDRLAEAYRFRAPDHDRYGFHISIAYTMSDLSSSEKTEYHAILQQAVDRITAATPVLELGLPAYCTFRDMYRFDTEVILRTA
jgi:hypothetical protein